MHMFAPNIRHQWIVASGVIVVLILVMFFAVFKLHPNYVEYTCDDNKKLYAVFMEDFMFINVQDEGAYILPWAMSGSGARYAYKDQSIIFHTKGDSAYFRRLNVDDLNCVSD